MPRLRCAKAPTAARSFLQIVTRSYTSAAAQSPAPFEFLLPRCTSPAVATPRVRIPSGAQRPSRSNAISRREGSFGHALLERFFTTSSVRQSTRSISNPQKDEDGNEMKLEITPRAAKRLSQIMDKDGNPDLALRIQVESGGCHGFQYLMSLITIPPKGSPEWSSVVREDDTIFQYHPDDENPTSSTQGPKIILDEPSLDLLKGSKVDFTMELIGSQFKIVDNPYATSSCGCGTSFDIKM